MLTEILILIATPLLAYAIYSYLRIHQRFKEADVKFLPGVPVLGNSYKSALQMQHMFDDVKEVYDAFPDEKYVLFMEGMVPVILIRDPELVKQISVKDFDYFPDHRIFLGDKLFDSNLFSMKGEKWRDMRTTLTPAFTGSKMRLMVPFIVEASIKTVQFLKENDGHEIEVNHIVSRYANDAIASSAYGYTVDSFKEPNNKFFRTSQKIVKFSTAQRFKILVFAMLPSLSKWFPMFDPAVTDFFRDLVKNTMRHREEHNIHRTDMIHLLMEAQKGTLKSTTNTEMDRIGFAIPEDYDVKSSQTKREWSSDEIAAQAFVFFLGGFNSVSSAITIAIHEMALNPEVQEKLYREVKLSSLRHEKLTYEVIQELSYLDAVSNETLRKWGSGGVHDRLCAKSYVLPPPHEGGKSYTINPKEGIYISAHGMRNDPKYFPNPERFNPERFSDENKSNIIPYTYFPFGCGPRNCIGSRYAVLSQKILLYYVVLNFKILKCNKTVEPIRMHGKNFVVKCVGGSWIKLASREM